MSTESSSSPLALVHAHTVEAAAPLCPELRLRLMTEDCQLYRADEGAAARAGLALPYWAIAWPGGQALARYLLDHPDWVRGKRVLDLGCGGAVEGIAAAKCGARAVVANDIDPLALVAAQANAALNGVTLETSVRDLIGQEIDAEVLLAGDVCYQHELTARMLEWLRGCARRGLTVLVGDPGRGFIPASALEPLAEYAVPFEGDPSGKLRRATVVGRLRPE